MAESASIWRSAIDAAKQWSAHKDSRMGAALSYYSVFSIGPLVLIAVAIAGLLFGREAVQGQVTSSLQELLGENGANAINGMLQSADKPKQGIVATIFGIVTLVFAAVGIVVQLKDAFNTVWEVEPSKQGGIWGFLRTYVLSLAGVLSLGFLLLISMLLTTALAAFGKYFGSALPESALQIAGLLVSFAVIALLFAMMFKWLPDAPVRWSDVWLGAVFSAVRNRKVPDWALHRKTGIGIDLRSGFIPRRHSDLGLLLCTDCPAWCRIHQRACQAARLRPESLRRGLRRQNPSRSQRPTRPKYPSVPVASTRALRGSQCSR